MTQRQNTGFWIKIDSVETARQAARQGFWAAILVAIMTTAFATLSIALGGMPAGTPQIDASAFWDVGFFVAIAWGIHKMSRIAAVAGLGLYVLGQVILRIEQPSLAPVGLIVAGLLTLAFVHGVRGTFAYHHFRRQQLNADRLAEGDAK